MIRFQVAPPATSGCPSTLLALWESRDGAAATVPLAGRGSARTDSGVASAGSQPRVGGLGPLATGHQAPLGTQGTPTLGILGILGIRIRDGGIRFSP